MLYKKAESIGSYKVAFPIKKGIYAETYRVKDAHGKNFFLKLINLARLQPNQFDSNGNVLEADIAKLLEGKNTIAHHDSFEFVLDGRRMLALVFEFISGETLSQYLARYGSMNVYEARDVLSDILRGLRFLHSRQDPVLHNDLTPQNVMLDFVSNPRSAIIIDFGHANVLSNGINIFPNEDRNPFYTASEAFNGVFTAQSDLFSAGAIFYTLLFGIPPYFVELSSYKADRQSLHEAVVLERRRPLTIPDNDLFEPNENWIDFIRTALAEDVDRRFHSADEMLDAAAGISSSGKIVQKANSYATDSHFLPESKEETIMPGGRGFADVAGMTELKEQLQSDVIDLLKNLDRARDLGLSLPNGLLFYGPPGCGKTFFAEKFAEEAGCNYIYVRCSDIASPYIHGGQGKIADIFAQARKNAPTIIFFDEIDAMIKDRRLHSNVSESGEVNEFLSQLNNCGQDGVIVIGATNKPNDIDRAALRAGRLEYKYYIPQPDRETRAKIFEIDLKRRKTDLGIDCYALADMTENYIAADIHFIVNKAARTVFRENLPKITMEILKSTIDETSPSISLKTLEEYEKFRDMFDTERK